MTKSAMPALRRNRKLHEQIENANDSVDANMKQGFEQPTDVALSNFVFTATGSTKEALARVKQAHRKRLITDEQLTQVEQLAVPLGKMMGGFIKYLEHRASRPWPSLRCANAAAPR